MILNINGNCSLGRNPRVVRYGTKMKMKPTSIVSMSYPVDKLQNGSRKELTCRDDVGVMKRLKHLASGNSQRYLDSCLQNRNTDSQFNLHLDILIRGCSQQDPKP